MKLDCRSAPEPAWIDESAAGHPIERLRRAVELSPDDAALLTDDEAVSFEALRLAFVRHFGDARRGVTAWTDEDVATWERLIKSGRADDRNLVYVIRCGWLGGPGWSALQGERSLSSVYTTRRSCSAALSRMRSRAVELGIHDGTRWTNLSLTDKGKRVAAYAASLREGSR